MNLIRRFQGNVLRVMGTKAIIMTAKNYRKIYAGSLPGFLKMIYIHIRVSKCSIVTFTHIISPINFNYLIGGLFLKSAIAVKGLGVIFSNHIDYTVSRTYIYYALLHKKKLNRFQDVNSLKAERREEES